MRPTFGYALVLFTVAGMALAAAFELTVAAADRSGNFTSSIGGREARSICFAVAVGTLNFTGYLRTPQPVNHTKASFKIFWFTDADSCTTPSTNPSDVQTAGRSST